METQNNETVEAINAYYDGTFQPFTKEETEKRKTLRDQFSIYGFSTLLYAVVFTACMYKNLCGIASTLLVIATVVYAYVILKKLGYEFKKKHIINGVILVLLAFNLMFTMDGFLHFIDYVAIIMVFVSGVLSVINDTARWDLGDSVTAVLRHVFGSLSNAFDFVSDWVAFAKDKSKKMGIISYVFVGIVISIPLMVVVLALLGDADAVFGKMLFDLFYDFDFGDVFGIAFVFALALLGSYAWIAHFVDEGTQITIRDKRTKEPAIMIVICISLGLVYLLFCGIQVMYLFMGAGTLPDGYTYAEYAREGFTQLMVVCFINVIIVLIGIKHFKENIILKIVLTIVTLCTYIMIISSAYRMNLYVKSYQLSVLRLWVLWTLVWLSFILTGALINIYKNSFSLFTYSMIVTSVLYLLMAYARPAYVVASYNLSPEFAQKDIIDYSYIRYDLNEDALTPVYKYYLIADEYSQEKLERYFEADYERELTETTIRNFNISRYRYCNAVIKMK